jgi:hypothetical protein
MHKSKIQNLKNHLIPCLPNGVSMHAHINKFRACETGFLYKGGKTLGISIHNGKKLEPKFVCSFLLWICTQTYILFQNKGRINKGDHRNMRGKIT